MTSTIGPMEVALAHLRALGLSPIKKTRYQLKLGRVSYYPGKDTIFVDGEDGARPETGLEALERVLRDVGVLR